MGVIHVVSGGEGELKEKRKQGESTNEMEASRPNKKLSKSPVIFFSDSDYFLPSIIDDPMVIEIIVN